MWRRGPLLVIPGWKTPIPTGWKSIVEAALAEDLGFGDISSAFLNPESTVRWQIEAQADGVLCGAGIALELLAPGAEDLESGSANLHVSDGEAVTNGTVVLAGVLSAPLLLGRERTALNFLMHLSGVATLTAKYVEAVSGTQAKIVDTRKSIPGMRSLQKYAVRCGGGHNHRMRLDDGVMLKDNHIRAAGSIGEAVRQVREVASHLSRVEVECENLEQVAEAVGAGAEVVMLDNMDMVSMKRAVDEFGNKCILEASGGVSLSSVREIAETGVHYISVGALTHSAPALAIHLEVE